MHVRQHLKQNLRTITTFLILLLIFGCKNKTQLKAESISQNSKVESQSNRVNPIFDLIINKRETAEDLKKEFSYDSIVSLSEEEKTKYKITGLEDGLYLTNIDFLKSTIDSINFKVYYRVSFGNQLEKLVRIQRKDTLFDLTLALTGGDGGQTWREDLEFLNDSIIQVNRIFTETAIDNTHLMAYSTDSIISKYQYDIEFNFEEIKKDSFHIYKEYPIYHKNLKDKIFKTWSNVFTVNGIKCNWEYEVKYTDQTNENSKEPLVNLISQKLLVWKTKELLLDLDLSKFIYIPPKSISELEYNQYPDSSIDNLKDVNSDKYTDIQFMTEHAGAGANTAYATYLFNSKNNKFEYSEVFSGYNIEYDPKTNRTSSFMKSGVDDYYYSFINLKENRKDVDFIENVHHSADTIFYTKMINEKVVKEKKIILGEYENWVKYLERK